MRVILQRVLSARVDIAGETQAEVGRGIMLLCGFAADDTDEDLRRLASRVPEMRIFEDANSRMNNSVRDIQGDILLVPNFTLYADTKRGRRPGFSAAAAPAVARPLFERFVELVRESGLVVATGVFGADMQVTLCNDGPVTLLIEEPGPS